MKKILSALLALITLTAVLTAAIPTAAVKTETVPKIISATSAAEGVKLSWSTAPSVGRYRVFIKNSKGGWSTRATVNGTSYVDTKVKSGTVYTYTVRGVDANGSFCTGYDRTGVTLRYVGTPAFRLSSKPLGLKVGITAIPGVKRYRVFFRNRYGSWKKLADCDCNGYLYKAAQNGAKYTLTVRALSDDGKKYISPYLKSGKALRYADPKLNYSRKEKAAHKVVMSIVNQITDDYSAMEKVALAADAVSYYSSRATYTNSDPDYATPYGVFVKGVYTCAGSTRALGMVLDYLGFDWKHVNENQYTHQWCELIVDGKKVYADGQANLVGYGTHPAAYQ